tara:strand:+ start:4561 stop:7383 length:2823 start_codon:yes stop_codon:yes gene_type:complete
MVNNKYAGSTNRSLPYNIVLTRDPNVIGQLFYDKLGRKRNFSDSFDNIPDYENENTFIISPRNNNEFISMDYTFNAEGQTFVSLKLVETDRLLEYFFITSNGWEEAVASRLSARKSVLGDTNNFDSLLSARPAFYLSFGAGDVFTSWAGPYVVQLADCNLSIDPNGIRQLELLFTPSQDTLKVFTDRLVSDTVHRKDSVFSTFKAQGPSSGKGRVIPADKVFKTKSEDSSFVGAILPSLGTDPGLITLDLKRSDVLDSEKDIRPLRVTGSVEDGTSPQGTPRVPTLGKQVERQGQAWNIAVRQLITEYLKKLFPTLPPGNTLTIFDDDLDAVYPIIKKDGVVVDNGRLVIEMPRSKNVRKDIISRCGTGLRNFGIDISYLPSKAKNVLNSKKSLNEIAGKGAVIQSGSNSSETDSNKGTNPQRQAEARPISKDNVVLSFSMLLDEEADLKGSPPALVPLMKFQRRLKEISNKPSDFVIYEEHNTDILRSLWDAGLIQDWRESVVIFGRKSNIDRLVYALSEPSDTLIANVFPTSDFDAVPIQNTRKKNAWRVCYLEQKARQDNLPNAGKRYTSSFGEKFDIPALSKNLNRTIRSDIPFFAANVKNANVLSLSFDSKPYVNVLMSTTYKSSYRVLDKYFKDNEDQLLKSRDLKFPFVEYIADKINKEKEEQRKTGRGSPRSNIKMLMDIMEKDKQAKLILYNDKKVQQLDDFSFLDLLLFKLNGSKFNLNTVEEIGEGNTHAKREADLIQQINRSIINVRLRTLPFFNTNFYLGQPCFLYGVANGVVGSRTWSDKNAMPQFEPYETRPAIFTNEYTIIGYKHHIDKESAFSEFTIAQPGFGAAGARVNNKVKDLFKKELQAAGVVYGKVAEEVEAFNSLVDRATEAKPGDSTSTFIVKEALGLYGGLLESLGYDQDKLMGDYALRVSKGLEDLDKESKEDK